MGKDNKVTTFNMVPKNDVLKKFGKRLAEILGIIAALLLLLSISPKNAVRMTMVLGG